MSDKDKNTTPPEGQSPTEAPEPQRGIGETTRSKAKKVLAKGPGTPPPNEPEAKKPPTREELIDRLHLKYQYDERADHMVDLIGKGVFKFGKNIPSLEATLGSFTTEQLELAQTLQEPTLLLVPETSFAAKMRALDTRKTIKEQNDAYAYDIFKTSHSGSKKVTGWRAVIVDGARKMKIKKGDNGRLPLVDRIRNRKAARGPGERGMDRHIYAMLMLEALGKSRPIDQAFETLLDDDPALSLDDDPAFSHRYVPKAFWRSIDRRVCYFWDIASVSNSNGYAQFRSSVGGDVQL